jgi:PAS domain S-box-containing protein
MPHSGRDKIRIIFLEDDANDFALVQRHLENGGLPCVLVRVESDRRFAEELAPPPDVILSDHHLPEFDGFAALQIAQARCPRVPFIFVTGAMSSEESAVAVQRGASEIVLKGGLFSLVPAINRARGIGEERTRRERAETALQHSEDRYRRLLELLPCAILVHQKGKIILANDAAAKLVGASDTDSFVGSDVSAFVLPESQEAVRERIERVEQGHTVPFLEEKIVRLDSSVIDVEVARTPVVLPDDPAPAVMVVAIDITERQRTREQIECLNAELEQRVQSRTAELERVVRELEAFSYSVSHDLRAPLRHIEGFADLLFQTTAANKLDGTNKEYLDIIIGSARQMGRLIDALLAFSRLGRTPIDRQPVNLRELLDRILHDLRYEMEGRQINWKIQPLPEINGDPSLLRQALYNLIANAIKYTRSRPVAEIAIGATHTPAEDIIYVKDNGVGFDMEFADKLFGVFQRLHPAADFEGVGIGLANVRRIVQRHGGRTWAEATPEQGATFYFSLPRTPGGDGL